MTFFTSDQHLGHRNIIRLCSRPFSSIEEMDENHDQQRSISNLPQCQSAPGSEHLHDNGGGETRPPQRTIPR